MQGGPEHGVVEGPVADRAGDHPEVARPQDAKRLRDAVDDRRSRGAEPAPHLGRVRVWRVARAETGEGDDQRQGERRECRRERGQPQRQVGPGEPERHHGADHGDGDEVHPALDQEEGDRAPRDPLAVHAGTVQDPGAEGQPGRAAGRHEGAHRELRAADLPTAPPAEAGAEDGAEHDDVGDEGEALEHRRHRQPDRVGMRERLARLAQPRRQEHDRHQDPERGERLEPAPAQRCGSEIRRVVGRWTRTTRIDCDGAGSRNGGRGSKWP